MNMRLFHPRQAGLREARRLRLAVLAAAGLAAVSAPLALAAPASAATVTVSSHFVWTSDAANTSGDSSYIVNGATDGQPGDLLFVTENYSPGGECPCNQQPLPLGVWYNASKGEWAAFTENGSAMPAGVSYNVLAIPSAKQGANAFVQTATSANTASSYTLINNPATNGQPSLKLQVTQNWSPAGGSGDVFNPHPVGVWYDTSAAEWGVFNEDSAAMPIGASFNVLVGAGPSNGGKLLGLKGTKRNTFGDAVFISNPNTTGNPNNVVFETPNFNPADTTLGVYNPVQTGVYYNGTDEAVFNEDLSAPPAGSASNLLIFSS